jgi:hypothetical protein
MVLYRRVDGCININTQQDANNTDIYAFRMIVKINSDYVPKHALTDVFAMGTLLVSCEAGIRGASGCKGI